MSEINIHDHCQVSLTYFKILLFLTLLNEIITKVWHLQFYSLAMCYKMAEK